AADQVLNDSLGLGKEAPRLESDDGAVNWRADGEMIARTSATADYGFASIQEGYAEGYTHKRWMTRYDSRVRDTHRAADRQTVFLDEAFTVGGSSLQYPGDPMGDFDEIIGCRCVIA